MRWDDDTRTLVLSRRNLMTLLAKLDRPDSARTITGSSISVTSEDDDEHYERLNRPAGRMHPLEEGILPKPSTGIC